MYAMSQVDLQKMAELAKSMHSAFDIEVKDGTSPKPSLSDGILEGVSTVEMITPEAPVVPPANPSVLEEIKADLVEKAGDGQIDDKIKFKTNSRGWIISLAETSFFDSGEAGIKADSLEILDAIAASLLPLPYQIRIEGHTDNTPIHTDRFPSNWVLSTARATFVTDHFLTHFSFDPKRLSVAGYGEYRPVADNGTPEGRAENRRVDIVLLNEESTEQEPQ